MDILQIQGLRKSFGNHQVLKGVDLQVPAHSIFGFIGQNGAGKTTTMKAILGLLHMDGGNILVDGESVAYGDTKTNRCIGYLPDVPEFYSFMTAYEYLLLCGELTGMKKVNREQRSDMLLQLVGLWDQRKKRIGGFSRGMKQRLGIAQALLNQPKLLICDEPTSALDPIGRKEILDILYKVKEHTTVLFSTHILSDVERICDQIAILHDGVIAIHGSLEEIQKCHKVDTLSIEFMKQKDVEKFLHHMKTDTFETVSQRQILLHSSELATLQKQVLQTMSEQEIAIRKLEVLEPNLENLFMEVVR